MKKTDFQIGLNHPDFTGIRETMDAALNHTLLRMTDGNFSEGSVTLKIVIEIAEDQQGNVDPETGEIIRKPVFGGKVSINIPQKASADIPTVIGNKLEYDAERKRFVMINPQISMDELLSEEDSEEEPEE